MKEIDQSRDQEQKFDLKNYLRSIWRKKYLVLVPMLVALLVAGVGMNFLVPIYQASSVIRMEDRKAIKQLEPFMQRGEGLRIHDRRALERIESDLQTSEFLDGLIKRLGMDKNEEMIAWADRMHRLRFPELSREELILRKLRSHIAKNIQVENIGPAMFRISYEDFDPEVAFLMADAITGYYIELQRQRRLEDLRQAGDFSSENVVLYKERLEKSERELDRFKEKMNKRKMAPNPVGEGNIRYAETLLKQIGIDIKDREAIVDRTRENLVALLGAVPSSEKVWGDEDFKKLENKLIEQRETRLMLQLAGRGEANEELTQNAREIAQTEKDLQRYLAGLVMASYPDYPDYVPLMVEYFYQWASLESFKQRETVLKSYIDAYRKRIALAPQLERQLEKLREEVERNRALYETFRKAAVTTQISEAAQSTELGTRVEMIERATRPIKPIKPKKPKIIVLSLMFGLVLGAGSLFLSEYSDTSFRSVEEIEKVLQIKVIGTIPRAEPRKILADPGSRRRVLVWATASLIMTVVALAGFYYYGKSTASNKLDLYRIIQTRR